MTKKGFEVATRRKQYLTTVNGALSLIVVLLIVQMWLLTATLEAYLGGHQDSALPGAIASALLFTGVLALYLLVNKIERSTR
jgi:hypothetical protein